MSGPKSPEEKRRSKYADYMRSAGTPLRITDEEVARLRDYLGGLVARGMSYTMIAESAPGCHAPTTVAKIVTGRIAATHRDVYNDLMRARFERPEQLRSGTRVDSTGMRRRLQALVAAGFGYHILGGKMGISGAAAFQLTRADRPIAASTAAKVADLYRALEVADPLDHGATRQGIARSRGVARRNGWAPRTCWDVDTIDDPATIPEWTGACGTQLGLSVHKRTRTPLCRACLELKYEQQRALKERRASERNTVDRRRSATSRAHP